MDIRIESVPHDAQRYDTAGDYFQDGDTLRVLISESGNEKYDHLVMLHELIELTLCKFGGVTIEQIDEWDMTFEGSGEPGDDPKAPYHKQHALATSFERLLASLLGVDWQEYDNAVARQEAEA